MRNRDFYSIVYSIVPGIALLESKTTGRRGSKGASASRWLEVETELGMLLTVSLWRFAAGRTCVFPFPRPTCHRPRAAESRTLSITPPNPPDPSPTVRVVSSRDAIGVCASVCEESTAPTDDEMTENAREPFQGYNQGKAGTVGKWDRKGVNARGRAGEAQGSTRVWAGVLGLWMPQSLACLQTSDTHKTATIRTTF